MPHADYGNGRVVTNVTMGDHDECRLLFLPMVTTVQAEFFKSDEHLCCGLKGCRKFSNQTKPSNIISE